MSPADTGGPDLVAHILALVPPWTRIYRIQRDIPMPLVTAVSQTHTCVYVTLVGKSISQTHVCM